MIFGQDRGELRQMYVEAWSRRVGGESLTPLQEGIAAVIAEHPEYQAALTESSLDKDFHPADGATNPFLHMGLHLGLREQITTNRPAGIRHVFSSLQNKVGDSHEAEHRMIECLAEALWTAQQNTTAPDEASYLKALQRLLR